MGDRFPTHVFVEVFGPLGIGGFNSDDGVAFFRFVYGEFIENFYGIYEAIHVILQPVGVVVTLGRHCFSQGAGGCTFSIPGFIQEQAEGKDFGWRNRIKICLSGADAQFDSLAARGGFQYFYSPGSVTHGLVPSWGGVVVIVSTQRDVVTLCK